MCFVSGGRSPLGACSRLRSVSISFSWAITEPARKSTMQKIWAEAGVSLCVYRLICRPPEPRASKKFYEKATLHGNIKRSAASVGYPFGGIDGVYVSCQVTFAQGSAQ